MQTKILITGASGLIGQKLVQFYHQLGVTVYVLTRNKNSKAQGSFYWNPATQEIDTKCFDGVGIIIHLAGAGIADKRWTHSYKQIILNSRVQSTKLLLNALKQTKHEVKHLVSTSAIGYYSQNSPNLIDEDSEAGNSFLANVCREWEQQAMSFSELGIPVAIVRVGLVLSRSGGMLKSIEMPTKLGVAAPFGKGNQMQSWIHIDDLVRLYAHICQFQLTGIYNGVAPEPVNNKEMLQQITKALHRPFFMPGIPKWCMQLLVGEMADLLYANQAVSSKKIAQKGFQFQYPNLHAALLNLYGFVSYQSNFLE